MIRNATPPPFTRVGRPLIEELLKLGESKRAFRLAADWSALDGDPEAVATFYSVLTNSEHPPPNLWEMLNRFR
jgi:hypothetical protein